MPDRRGSRFVLEVLFLLALAVALTLSRLSPIEIAGVMLGGGVIVALFEWAAWRNEPHYGSGLPPRYYVPRVDLPPAQPLEQVPAPAPTGYPEARDEAPTWIASAALRAEVLGDWPMASPVVTEDTQDDDAVPLPPVSEPEPEAEPEPEPVAEAFEEPPTAEDAEAEFDVVLSQSVQGVARYRLDPLGEQPQKKRFGRGGGTEPAVVEVPARPQGVRPLPGRSMRED
jgi:hypothetical protein